MVIHRNFTLETYYTIMLKDFNNLVVAGSVHALNDTRKINAFEQGLKYPQAIHWCIILKECWDNLPPAEQTFDRFYKKFSKYISKYKSLSSVSNHSSCIGAFKNQGRGEHENGRGRGRGHDHSRGRSRGRGRVSGRGRGRGRGFFISDFTSPRSMITYPNTRRRNFASGDSRTLTVRVAQKGGTTSTQIEAIL